MGKSEQRGTSKYLTRQTSLGSRQSSLGGRQTSAGGDSKNRIRKGQATVQLAKIGPIPATGLPDKKHQPPAPPVENVVYGSLHGENSVDPKAKRKNAILPSAEVSKSKSSPKLGADDDNDDGEETTYKQLLIKNRPFRLYMTSYICNHIGEWLTYLASITAIEEIQLQQGVHTTSRTAISALIIIRLLPNVLLSPFGGVLADGMDRRKAMMMLDVLGALVALLFVLAMQHDSIPLIYLATFLQECVAGIYEPSRSAIIPLLVPDEEELKKATTLAQLAWSVVAAFGSAAGGFVVSLLGIQACYVIDSATYMVSAYLMMKVGGKWNVSSDEVAHKAGPWEQIRGMVWDGVLYLKGSFFGGLVFLKFSAALVYGAMDVLNVSFSERGNVAGRSTRLGLLFAAVGVGCLVGPLLADRYTDMSCPRTLQLACLHSILLVSVGSLLMGMMFPFWIICALSAIRSMGQSIIWIDSSLLLQKFSDPEMLGRVSATDYALALLAESLSAVAAGVLQDEFRYDAEHASFLLGGFGLFLSALWYVYHRSGGGAADYVEEESSTDTPTTEATALMDAHLP